MLEINATFAFGCFFNKKSAKWMRPPPFDAKQLVQSGGSDAFRPQIVRHFCCMHAGMYVSEKGGPESSMTSTGMHPNASCTMLKFRAAPKPPALAPVRMTWVTLSLNVGTTWLTNSRMFK